MTGWHEFCSARGGTPGREKQTPPAGVLAGQIEKKLTFRHGLLTIEVALRCDFLMHDEVARGGTPGREKQTPPAGVPAGQV